MFKHKFLISNVLHHKSMKIYNNFGKRASGPDGLALALVIRPFELPFDPDTDMDSMQPGTFLLFTVNFNTLATGTSPISHSVNTLADSFGAGLTSRQLE
jgi:hypothetical protein